MADSKSDNEKEKTNDIYTEIHKKMMTSNSGNTPGTPAEVDISGALNASAALNASSALKTNSNTETVKDGISAVSSNKVNSNSENETEDSDKTSPSLQGNISGTLKPEAFIDGIEKFVNFVSKEGLAKKMNESTASTKKESVNIEVKVENIVASGDGQESKSTASDKKTGEKEPKKSSEVDDVDADLKSYALAVTDMLDNEVEVPTDGNELDAEIKTMVVSNNDAGEVKMTFTDNAVGRFETIGKSDDKGDTLADGLSPLRKSRRPKKRKVYTDFDHPDDAELEKMVDEVSRAIANVEEKKAETPARPKSKRKNPSPKKAKLTVDEVYQSDSNDESDGDISKDTLKVRMAKCDVCDKHFLDRKKLTEHKRRHNRNLMQSEYPCVVCEKVFLKREHWRRHVKIHDDIRPYACPVCRKAFRRNEHVKRHMLVHTGEKPFECMFCSQRYQRADHLKKHLQQHTKGEFSERKRKNPKNQSTKTKKRRPTTKATELIVLSRKKKVKKEEIAEPLEEHYSDGLSDEDQDKCAENNELFDEDKDTCADNNVLSDAENNGLSGEDKDTCAENNGLSNEDKDTCAENNGLKDKCAENNGFKDKCAENNGLIDEDKDKCEVLKDDDNRDNI